MSGFLCSWERLAIPFVVYLHLASLVCSPF